MEKNFRQNISDIQYDSQKNPRKIRGDFPLPDVVEDDASRGDVIKSFLYANADDLSLKTIDYQDLRLFQDVSSPVRRVVRYQQYKDELPVFGATLTVQVDTDGAVKQMDLGQESDTRVISPVSDEIGKLTPEKAVEVASGALGSFTLREAISQPTELYYPAPNGLKLAFQVVISTKEPVHSWRIIVDAYTGEILYKDDLMVFYNGRGYVFDPNPVVTSGNNALRDPMATNGVCGFSGSQRLLIDNQRWDVELKDITLSAGKYVLEGPYVKMVKTWGGIEPPTETDKDNFKYSSKDDAFGDVNVYYHIDSFQRYIQSLGIPNAHNQQIEADAHDSDNGAWFYSIDKALHFGRSGIYDINQKKYIEMECKPDRCQDADCFLHEYNHAIMHHYVPGYGFKNPITKRNEARALGEGYGDVIPCMYFAEKGGGYQKEVFEDWCYADEGGMRRVDGNKMYPWNIPVGPGGDWVDEEHYDGEIWSAALWKVYLDTGGKSTLDPAERKAASDALIKTIITSYPTLTTSASMPDGAEALMIANAELDYRGKHLMEMLNSFHDRGILRVSSKADLGIDPGSAFYDSPNVWVRNEKDGGTAHQNPEYGQDNWFYARVINHGTEAARAFVVTFNVKPWLGTEFTFPGDFLPFMSAAVGFNLAPGASTIVKAKWPKTLVPLEGTHGCLLVSVYLPTEGIPAGSHVWEHQNLAQKNLKIVDLKANDFIVVPVQLGTDRLLKPEAYRIELHRPERWSQMKLEIVHSDPQVVKKLYQSFEEIKIPSTINVVRNPTYLHVVEAPAHLEFYPAGIKAQPIRMTLALGSTVDLDIAEATEPETLGDESNYKEMDAQLVTDKSGTASIAFKPGVAVGFPVIFEPRKPANVKLKVTAPPEAKLGDSFDIDLVQKNRGGVIVGGVRIHVNIIE